MRIEHQFSIAGFEVSVSFPDGWDADTLLLAFGLALLCSLTFA